MLIRGLSALAGVAILIGVWQLFGAQGMAAVCSLVTLLACMEFSGFLLKHSRASRYLFVLLSFAFYLTTAFYSVSILGFLCFFAFIVSYFVLLTPLSVKHRVRNMTLWSVGALYCGAFTGVVTHGLLLYGGNYFLAVLLLSFMTDTAAYLGGRLFGKTPLAPMISPKKTVEGSVCGTVVGAASGFYFLYQALPQAPIYLLVLACLAGSFLSQVGDLFESVLKRYSGLKDSGKILPGHGGILDRIDGVLFAGPVVFFLMASL